MAMHRTKGTIIGLLEASRVNEWIVTEKLGDASKPKLAAKTPKKPRFWIGERYAISFQFASFHSEVAILSLTKCIPKLSLKQKFVRMPYKN